MTDANYKATLVILNDIEKKGLYQFNKEYHDEEFFRNFIEFQKSFSNTFEKIIQKYTFESDTTFAVYALMSYVNSHLQVFEKFLKIIINQTMLKGGFNENTTLSQMIRKICNKMQYSVRLKNSISGLFLVNFSDTIIHQHYRIYKNGTIVIYPKDQKEREINLNDLYDYSLQVRSMFHAMLDWADTTKKPRTKTILDDTVNELIHQIKSLDKKLDMLS